MLRNMRKDEFEVFNEIFGLSKIEKKGHNKLNIKHRDFSLISNDEEYIFLSSSSTFTKEVNIQKRRIIRIIRHN